MDKKQEILNVTYKLFSEKGYDLSMSEIANAVRIKTPSLYSHFKSKEEIIELTIRSEIEHCFDTIYKKSAELENKSCEEKLKSILFLAIDYYNECGRLNFWKHIPLVECEKLKIIIKASTKNRNSYLSQEIRNFFQQGIKNKEIKENLSEGSIYLYSFLLQGILDEMLFYEDNIIPIKNSALTAWEAYWDSIKFRD